MEDEQAWWLLAMVIGAIILGVMVFFFNPDYRFKEITESNEDYYSHVDVNSP